MKYLKLYEQFSKLFEFNNQDKQFISNLDNYFTLAIEYEIVANEDIEDEPPVDDIEKALEFVKSQTFLDLSRGKMESSGYFLDKRFPKSWFVGNEEKMIKENPTPTDRLHKSYRTWTWVNKFIDTYLAKVDEDDSDKTFRKIDPSKFKDELEIQIIDSLAQNVSKFVFSQNMSYLIERVEEKLPNFWKKWGSTFKFELEGDDEKQRILEMSPKTYIDGLSKAIEQLNDFYNDLNKQKYWVLNERTALHINVGVKGDVKWNVLKGLLYLSDYEREEKAEKGKMPYVFKDIEWRLDNRHAGSIIDGIINSITGNMDLTIYDEDTSDEDDDYEDEDINASFRSVKNIIANKEELITNIDKLSLDNISSVEDYLNKFIIQSNRDFYIKEFGIKLTETDKNYVEYRYIGGNVAHNVMIDKIKYFCYITYLMTNSEYKRKDYLKKLYVFVDKLKTIIKKNI